VALQLDRLQAMDLLKELVSNNLVDPSYVSIGLRKPTQYQIQIKCDYNMVAIEAHAKKYNLTIEEDTEKRYLVIFKP
jgi:hypothetical protein